MKPPSAHALRAVLDLVPDIIVRYDRSLRRTYVSPSYERWTGTPAEQVLGKTVDEFSLSPAIAADLRNALLRVFATGAGETIELADQVGDRWLQVEMVPERDGDDPVAAVIAVGRDVTALKSQEAALRESEVRYRTLVERIPAITYVTGADADAPVLYVSPQVERFLGHSAEELTADPLNWARCLHPDDRDRVTAVVQEAARAQEGYALDYRVVARDGRTRWFRDESVSLHDADGRVTAYQGVAFDITARIEAEQALARSESRFRALIEHARDLVSIIDAEGVVRYASPSHQAVLGYAVSELEGRNAFELVHADDRAQLHAIMEEGIGRGATTVPLQTYRYRHRDGSYRVIESSATNLLADPAVRGVVVNSRDVTERVQLQAELTQSQKMEAVGRLAGGVAHDFNNILTVINSNAEFLIEALPERDPRRQDAQEIRDAARRAANLTRQLLAFSRRQVLEPRPLGLSDVVQDLGKMLERLIGEDVELVLETGDDVPRIVADPGQLEQVILNLAVNARDAMPDGGRLIIRSGAREIGGPHGRSEEALPPGRWALLEVADTGVGMSPDVVEQIFEPFFTTKEHGTGLGLATVYGIVRQSGGQITVDSAPGVGTTFRVYLPENASQGASDEPAAAAPDEAEGASASGRVILLVEDDAPVRAQAVRILEAEGYRVLDAGSGCDALQVAEAQNGRLDLLLTDVVMPRMNGRELAERMRARWPGIRVLYTSGYTGEAVDRHGLLGTGMSFLPKPYTGELLRRRVADILNGARRRA